MSSLKGLQHLAFIMDGNGRWASDRDLPRSAGHRKGYEALRAVIKHLITLKIPEVTFFALSTENLTRPADEVSCLMDLFLDAVKHDIALLVDNRVHIRVVGDLSSLTWPVRKAIDVLHAQKVTAPVMQMNICFAYSGKWHIENAFERCAATKGDLQTFRQYLSEPFLHPMDLVIRSGNVSRISNFALWQLAYSELMFLPHYWPDMTSAIVDDCIKDFYLHKRRFGQVS